MAGKAAWGSVLTRGAAGPPDVPSLGGLVTEGPLVSYLLSALDLLHWSRPSAALLESILIAVRRCCQAAGKGGYESRGRGDVVWRASVRSHDSTHAVMRRVLSGDGEEPAQVCSRKAWLRKKAWEMGQAARSKDLFLC
ncbi:hypothetical protein PO909_006993 [Leuciscus waleckii]